MHALASTALLALAAAAASVTAAPAPAAAKRDITYGAVLGPLPLIINTWYNGHSSDYHTTNLTLDPNAPDENAHFKLDAYPDGHNATAQPFEFKIIGSEALGISSKVNWTADGQQAYAYGVLRSAATPGHCLQAIGWDDSQEGHFGSAPCRYTDTSDALRTELFKVSFQPSGPNDSWGYWHLYFVSDRPFDMGINGYTPSFADDPRRTVTWDKSSLDTTRHLFCFPFNQYIEPIPGA